MKAHTEQTDTAFTSPQGTFFCLRHGHPKEKLRAWNSADLYMLEAVAKLEAVPRVGHVLIVNDGFGALSLALRNYAPDVLTDSAQSRRTIQANFEKNGFTANLPRLLTRFELSEQEQSKHYDLVMFKVPKSGAQLEDQLRRITPFIALSSTFIAGAMSKAIQKSTVQAFETSIGPATCSLAHKRARLIRVTAERQTVYQPMPMASCIIPASLTHNGQDLELMSVAGTFAHGKLDQGARAMLEVLELTRQPESILDYGCGNGILGIIAGLQCPDARTTFVDDSAAAIVSTQTNIERHFNASQLKQSQLLEQDSLENIASDSVDVVLNNPPFHDAGARSSYIAHGMFKDALRVLKPGGEIWVVGNRHLQYERVLRQLFAQCEHKGKHSKFVILKAIKSG